MSQTESGQSVSSSPNVTIKDHHILANEETTQEDLANQNIVTNGVPSSEEIKDDKKSTADEQQESIMVPHTKHDMEDAMLLQELFISGNNRVESNDEKKKTSEETVKLPKKKRKIELNQQKDEDDEKAAYDSRQFKKIDENIYLGDSTVYAWKNLFDDDIIMCSCGPSKKGDITGDDHCGEYCVNRLLCMECVIGYCSCGSKCTNNRFQKKGWKKIEVKRAGEKGFGVFAKERISKGTFIIEYVGEVLDEKIYKQRQEAYDGERHYYFLSVGTNQIIDASKKGNNARFINHSCDPNAVLQKWTVGHQSRIGVFALRDIEKGEEVTFDYAMECYGVSFQKCYCGSANCRGTITSKDMSLLEAKEKSSQMDSEQAKKLRAHKLESKFKQRTLYTLKILEDSSKLPKEVIDSANYGNTFLIRNIRRTEKKRFRQFLSIEKQLSDTQKKEDETQLDEFGLTVYERALMTQMYEQTQKGARTRNKEIKSRKCKGVGSSSSLSETANAAQPRVTRTAKKKVEEEPKKKRGRPPKREAEESDSESEEEESELSYDEESEDEKTKSKRRVGRPKKTEEEPKRKVGRPRKSETSSSSDSKEKEKSKTRTETSKTDTKRKVGRPKKEESTERNQKKRKVESSSSESESDSDRDSRSDAKRKVGRPRKVETKPIITTPKVEEEKRRVGRPKKVVEEKKVEKKPTTTSTTTSNIKTEQKSSTSSSSTKPTLTTPKQRVEQQSKPVKSSSSSSASSSVKKEPESEAPKRKVGRPRKDETETKPKEEAVVKKESTSKQSSSNSSNAKSESSDSKPRRIVHNTKVKEESSSDSEEEAPKRKVGRPRKDEQKVKKETKEEEPKRKVGRPRKDEQSEPKRKVGRPRKVVQSSSSGSESESESEDEKSQEDEYEMFRRFNVRISKVKAYEGMSSLPNKRKYNSHKPRT